MYATIIKKVNVAQLLGPPAPAQPRSGAPQRWVSTANAVPVPVFGPPGVYQVVTGLRLAYAQDQHYRVAHHNDATVPASGFGGTARPFAPGRSSISKVIDSPATAGIQ